MGNHRPFSYLRRLIAVAMGIVTIGAKPCAVAAPFANLGFESSEVTQTGLNYWSESSQPELIPLAISIAPWSINDSGSVAMVNVACLGSPQCVSVQDGSDFGASLPLEGRYSLLLQSGDISEVVVTSISQVGDIPSDARSLEFLFDRNYATDSLDRGFSVLLAGKTLNLVNMGSAGSATQLAANLPAGIAGTRAELRVHVKFVDNDELNAVVDAFTFSSSTVPELATGALFAVASLCVGVVGHRRREAPSALGHKGSSPG